MEFTDDEKNAFIYELALLQMIEHISNIIFLYLKRNIMSYQPFAITLIIILK